MKTEEIKTDEIERKLQKYYKRYIRSIKNIVKKAERITGTKMDIEGVSARTRNDTISIASKIVQENKYCDIDWAVVNNNFEKILDVVEKAKIYEINDIFGIKGKSNIYQHGRLGVYRALNKYDSTRGVRLITYINMNVYYEFAHSTFGYTKDRLCATGITNDIIKQYAKMIKLYDRECAGNINTFYDKYETTDLKQWKKSRQGPDDPFCWSDFFELDNCEIDNVLDVDNIDCL